MADTVEEGPSVDVQFCQVCQIRQRHYKCPRCAVFSCSLECCKKHKVQTECSGRRDRTAYVSISGFTSANLRNDYHFLEDVLQTKDCANRTLISNCGGLPNKFKKNIQSAKRNGKKRPHHQKQQDGDDLGSDDGQGEAAPMPLLGPRAPPQQLDMHTQGVRNFVAGASSPGRDTRVIVMSQGMSRRKQNTSYFRSKTNEMMWRIHAVFVICAARDTVGTKNRLIFDPSILLRPELETTTESAVSTLPFPNDPSAASYLVGMTLTAVNENDTIESILVKLLDPLPGNAVQRHTLRSLRHRRAEMVCLMQHIPSPSANPIFVEVAKDGAIREALQGRTIIEYPTLVFALPEHCAHLRRFVAEAEVLESPTKQPRIDNRGADRGDGGDGDDDDEDEDEEEDDEAEVDVDFLSALKDLETKDISALKAIIEVQEELLCEQ